MDMYFLDLERKSTFKKYGKTWVNTSGWKRSRSKFVFIF